METITLNPTNTAFANDAIAAAITSAKATDNVAGAARPKAAKSPAAYVMDLLGEGLKQNFLGPNIDMEFLMLTVRSLATSSAKAVRQFVQKHSAAGMPNPKRFRINQHTLSHS